MADMTWATLQRLCDDEPPLLVWREERGLTLDQLAQLTGINPDRLARLDNETDAANEAELGKLATVLSVPPEYLLLPRDDSSTIQHACECNLSG